MGERGSSVPRENEKRAPPRRRKKKRKVPASQPLERTVLSLL
jgi:hypothetical protein